MRRDSILMTAIILAATLTSASVLRAGHATDSADRNRTFGEGIGLCVKFSQGQPLKDLGLLTDLGVRWVRDSEAWVRVERAAGKYEFSPALKERLAFYRQNNIAVVFILAYDNKIAYPPTPDDPCRNINPEAFGRYAAAAARLLRESGVRFVLEIWNEPHNFVLGKQLGGPWHGAAPCPWLDHYLKRGPALPHQRRGGPVFLDGEFAGKD